MKRRRPAYGCTLSAADFPAGTVSVTVYSGRKSLCTAQLQYYTNMEELTCLLSKVADPVDFMCQVRKRFNVFSDLGEFLKCYCLL